MERIKTIIAVCSFFWACVISAVALMLPPAGVIDSTVLVLVAQLLVLVSTIVGINLPIIINRNGPNVNSKMAKA